MKIKEFIWNLLNLDVESEVYISNQEELTQPNLIKARDQKGNFIIVRGK